MESVLILLNFVHSVQNLFRFCLKFLTTETTRQALETFWKTMSTEQNKALVRRFQVEMWKGNLAIIDELVAPETELAGVTRDQWKASVRESLELMPDLGFTIDEMIAEGDTVMFRWTMTGTLAKVMSTPYGPAQPTGKLITATGISIHRFENGQIVEDRFENSSLDYYTQLGVLPAPAPGS